MDFRNAEELHAGLYQKKEWWKRTYRKQLWYKHCRGKNVVRIDNDSDISALIHEYPFQYPSGKKKPEKCIMYLAADVEDKGKPVAMRVIFFWDW